MSGTVVVPKSVKGKSGLLTTEFWKSAIVNVLALLTMVGEIKPTGNPKYDSIISAAAGLAAAANNIGYANSRGKTKAAVIQAASDVINVAERNNFLQQTGKAPAATANVSGG